MSRCATVILNKKIGLVTLWRHVEVTNFIKACRRLLLKVVSFEWRRDDVRSWLERCPDRLSGDLSASVCARHALYRHHINTKLN